MQRLATLATLVGCLLPGVSPAQTPPLRFQDVVKVEHAEMDFSTLRTYAWVPSPERADNLAEHIRISQAIERDLERAGFGRDEEGSPHVYVNYQVSTRKKTRSVPRSESSAWDPNNRRTMVDIRRTNTGTLVIRFLSGSSRERIWQGTLEYDVATEDMVLEQLDRNVGVILAEYPPKPKQEGDSPPPPGEK